MVLELIDAEFAICRDCLLADAGYDEHDLGYIPEFKSWGKLMDGDDRLVYLWSQDYDDDGEEPIRHFAWSDCPACGCTLGGDRYEGHLFLNK